MRGLSRDNEAILREFCDQGINDVVEPATAGDDGPLPFVRSAAVKHLGNDTQLGRAAQPVGDRLELARQLVQFVTKRRRRPRNRR